MSFNEDFWQYTNLKDEEIKKMSDDCIFVLDANVILNLYIYPKDVREKFFLAFDKLSGRIFIPYQVGVEYLRNRLEKIQRNEFAYSDLNKALEESKRLISSGLIKFNGFTLIDVDKWQKRVDVCIGDIKKELNDQKSQIKKLSYNEDPIKDKISMIFDKSILPKFPDEELNKIYEEGRVRFEASIPPGYEDDGKSGIRKYGDFVIWKHILVLAKSKNKPIIFISNDNKPDWCIEIEGKLFPRPELRREIFEHAKVQFHIYNNKSFLAWAGEKFQFDTKKELLEINKVDSSKYSKYIEDLFKSNISYFRFGRLSGTIFNNSGKPIPNLRIELWDYEEGGKIPSITRAPDNPQVTCDGTKCKTGMYSFLRIPYGKYEIVIPDYKQSYIIEVDCVEVTHDIYLPFE